MQPSHADVILGLTHSLGIMAIVVMGFGTALRLATPRLGRDAIVGILFAGGGILSMLDPVQVAPGVFVDARNILLALAGPLGGLTATLISVIAVGTFRIYQGGVGAMTGVMGIVLVGAIGYGYAWIRTPGRHRVRELLALGCGSCATILLTLFLPADIASTVFEKVALPYMVTSIVGVVLAGLFFSREEYRFAIENKLRNEARVDALTNLANRRAFDRQAPSMAFHTTRRGARYTIIMIDIDRFKVINDTYGHQVGDYVLAQVARIVAAQTRKNDLVARYGGEEIAVLIPSSDETDGIHVGGRIREQIEQASFVINQRTLKVTVSVGVSVSDAQLPFEAVFRAADEALYAAKNGGRNRVELRALAA